MYPHLLEIDISGCDMIGDESIVNFVSVFRHLQVLKVRNNANITDNSLKSIARDLKDLHQLDICFCPKISNAGLFTVAKYCKNCKQIYVGDHQFPNQLVEVVENMSVRITKCGLGSGSDWLPNDRPLITHDNMMIDVIDKVFSN